MAKKKVNKLETKGKKQDQKGLRYISSIASEHLVELNLTIYVSKI